MRFSDHILTAIPNVVFEQQRQIAKIINAFHVGRLNGRPFKTFPIKRRLRSRVPDQLTQPSVLKRAELIRAPPLGLLQLSPAAQRTQASQGILSRIEDMLGQP